MQGYVRFAWKQIERTELSSSHELNQTTLFTNVTPTSLVSLLTFPAGKAYSSSFLYKYSYFKICPMLASVGEIMILVRFTPIGLDWRDSSLSSLSSLEYIGS